MITTCLFSVFYYNAYYLSTIESTYRGLNYQTVPGIYSSFSLIYNPRI